MHQRTLGVSAGFFPGLELLDRQQVIPFVVLLEIHVRQWFARGRFQMQNLSFKPIRTLHRIAGKLIYDVTGIVHHN